jgi:transcriptional regulator with XRE-family HTH domain
MIFRDWIVQKYNEWSDYGRKSENQFAMYLGVNPATYNSWKNGTRGEPKRKEIIDKIAERYPEVYEVLGMPGPSSPFDSLSPTLRSALASAVYSADRRISEMGIDTDSPEARKIFREELDKHLDNL